MNTNNFENGFCGMEKKKIAFVIYSMGSGGAERVVSILSNTLVKNFNITIITFADRCSFYELHPEVTLLCCKNTVKPSKNIFESLVLNYSLYESIVRILKEQRVDICIGFMISSNVLATLASKRLGIPVIISERNNPYIQNASVSSFWKFLRRLVYPMADILTVQTPRVRTFYTSFIKERKLVTIPNPINPDFNRAIEVKKQNIILNVGSLENQKGQDVLIRAFSEAQLEGWQLHIVGEGSQKRKLTELIEDLDLQERVFLLGRKSNIAEHYASRKIFAFSSLYEGFPNALLEAMYFGLPCISTDCPTGPAELIEDGVNGYLVAVNDTNALTLKLQKLAANDDLRIAMGQAASKSVEQYRSEEIVGKWKHVIDRLLKQHN